jgi:cation transport regulator ChaB
MDHIKNEMNSEIAAIKNDIYNEAFNAAIQSVIDHINSRLTSYERENGFREVAVCMQLIADIRDITSYWNHRTDDE